MKLASRMFSILCGAVFVASLFAMGANAQCGATDNNRNTANASSLVQRSQFFAAGKQFTGRGRDFNSIVGLWRVTFTSKGTQGIPDDTVIDAGFSVWHSDGTEILNSSRPPATGSFCLGVWERSNNGVYNLNHFALSWDSDGNFVGPAEIREHVTTGKHGDTYSGTFTLDQYDLAGNVKMHIQGVVSAVRVTVDTTHDDLF